MEVSGGIDISCKLGVHIAVLGRGHSSVCASHSIARSHSRLSGILSSFENMRDVLRALLASNSASFGRLEVNYPTTYKLSMASSVVARLYRSDAY